MRLARAAVLVGSVLAASVFLMTDVAAAHPLSAGHASTQVAAAPAEGARAAPAAPAGVDDFTFSSFDADYYLGTDAAGRSTLKTVETLVAQFPDSDQNHGIRRAIPLDSDGHPTDIDIDSVVDQNGKARSFETDTSDDDSDGNFLLVTIAADGFVHGTQSYVLTYTQHNVTRHFADTNDDEFYWDTNGTGWAQPFDSVTARVHVPQALSGSLTGDASCYVGVSGSKTPCPISDAPGSGGETVFTSSQNDVGSHQNVTMAIGFEPGTFVPRDDSFFASWTGFGQLIAGALAALAAIGAAIYRFTVLRDAPGRPTVVAEYTPPKGVNIFTSAVVLKRTRRAIASAFVDLAVRHQVQIVERPSESRWSSAPVYWLHQLTTEGLDDQEKRLARLLFGHSPDGWHELKKNDAVLAKGVVSFMTDARKHAIADGYLRKGTKLWAAVFAALAVLFGLGAMVFGFIVLDDDRGGLTPAIFMAVAIASVVVVMALVFRTPLTAKGSELRDYLLGIELYIKVAEEERYRMLQSPEGALRTQLSTPPGAAAGVDAPYGTPSGGRPADSPDWGQVVKIYEKLLPYAVLFGLEDEWAKVLGTYYESLGSQPDWYYGSTAFNAGFFAASVASFSSSASTSYSGSSSSSSSGGSGGGGFSGGGGGGGGGGGV
jgi:uncharacterized membrane protein YgcG